MAHTLVQLANGQWSLRSLDAAETYHPVIGPSAESNQLYANQIQLERMEISAEPFIVWDVGLGGAANIIAVIKKAGNYAGKLQIYSFEHDLEPLQLAIENTDKLPYLQGFESPIRQLLSHHSVQFNHGQAQICWNLIYGDFPTWLKSEDSFRLPSPMGILYDAFSPKKNPDMYTLEVFRNVFNHLSSKVLCLLPSYSRATLMRTTLLLAGFYVGKGAATGEKEETTLAGNMQSALNEPLDERWFLRAIRSNSAEPLMTPEYTQKPLSKENLQKLKSHPQFADLRLCE